MSASCGNCASTLAMPEGETIILCCDDCFAKIMKPMSTECSHFANRIRMMCQGKIKEIADKQYSEKA